MCLPCFPLTPLSSPPPTSHADVVISVIIYLLMQTWPCPRYAVRQKYSYCSHCETNKGWDRRDINYCSTAIMFHISLSNLSTRHITYHTHTQMRVCLTCVFTNGYTYEKGTLFNSVTCIWIKCEITKDKQSQKGQERERGRQMGYAYRKQVRQSAFWSLLCLNGFLQRYRRVNPSWLTGVKQATWDNWN